MDTPTRASIAMLSRHRARLLQVISDESGVLAEAESAVRTAKDNIARAKVEAQDVVEALITLGAE